jgi:hypothetical protein
MADEPRPNLELLRKVLRHIDAHPEEYDQGNFAVRTECGTAYCIAGHACVMSGFRFKWHKNMEQSASLACGVGADPKATELLGLTDGEAEYLFDPENDREGIEDLAMEIAARAGEPLWPEGVGA